jgi:hypothetical protein
MINRHIFRLMAIVPIILFLGGLVMLLTVTWPDGAGIGVSLWAIALLLVGIHLATPAITARRIARRYPEQFVGETVVTLDDAGLHATKGEIEARRAWSTMTDFVEDSEFIVIRQGKLAVAVIPKRAFVDDAARTSFVVALRHHLPAGADAIAVA